MLKSFQGIYKAGRVELLEPPPDGIEGRVIVTFLEEGGPVDLAARGIDVEQARDLQRRLAPFADDWQRPDMDVYDAS